MTSRDGRGASSGGSKGDARRDSDSRGHGRISNGDCEGHVSSVRVTVGPVIVTVTTS